MREWRREGEMVEEGGEMVKEGGGDGGGGGGDGGGGRGICGVGVLPKSISRLVSQYTLTTIHKRNY